MLERKIYLALSLLLASLFPASLLFASPWPALVAVILWIPLLDRSRQSPYLPSLMYHSVSDHYERFPKSELTVSLRNFRLAMKWLKWRRYRMLSFAECEAFTKGEIPDRKVIHLTFDDGYLDNWVNVWPVLASLQLKGTVFVTDDFIRREGQARPVRTAEVGDKLLDEWGFMNQAEILAADKSGVLEFLPHGKTHTWYPKSDQLLGFHLCGDRQIWLDWNLSSADKADWINDFPQSIAGDGYPVLEFGKSLEVTRFIEDQQLLKAFQLEASRQGIAQDADSLSAAWRDFRQKHPSIGRLESQDERFARLREELESTRLYLQDLLDKPCDYFCWPGGGKQPESLALAYEELGYRMTTTHQYEIPNRRGHVDRWLYRVNAGYSVRFENRWWNLLLFASHVEFYRRNYCWALPFAFCQFVEGLAARMGRKRRKKDRVLKPIGLEATS